MNVTLEEAAFNSSDVTRLSNSTSIAQSSVIGLHGSSLTSLLRISGSSNLQCNECQSHSDEGDQTICR